ncbi:MAG: glycosyltransferase [Granulosicoccaceae bacterium]
MSSRSAQDQKAAKHITLVLKGYPRLSETFIAQEILALEQRGYVIELVSLRHPTDTSRHPVHERIQAPVRYLPEYLHQEPKRVLLGLLHCMFKRDFKPAVKHFWRDLKRDRTRNRVRRFGQAMVLAKELKSDTDILYAHFMHTPASVTQYAAILCQKPWACSAHAKDIWTSPDWELEEKLDTMRWLATCTQANQQHLSSLASQPEKVNLVYHGIDSQRFAVAPERKGHPADGSDAKHPVRILSVGRAVEKKGYDNLLAALAKLPTEIHWRFDHIGGGSLLQKLEAQAKALGIADRVHWMGALPQPAVLDAYRNADIFVLASRVTGDGDRDGLPNVLMEAQTQGLCCLSTNISGIPELIESEQTGILVEPSDEQALAQQLARLSTNTELRLRLARAGQHKVRTVFDMHTGIDHLVELFGEPATP